MPHGIFVQETNVLYNQTKLVLRTDGFRQCHLSRYNALPIVKVQSRSQSLEAPAKCLTFTLNLVSG
ncbi:MAG: hypothetical protein KME17_07985 [Cyanosarcina radialis HA8281-LM2]|nr:hypothetical protein [Cyanosarcina radialis HA8281-LM2]